MADFKQTKQRSSSLPNSMQKQTSTEYYEAMEKQLYRESQNSAQLTSISKTQQSTNDDTASSNFDYFGRQVNLSGIF